jgi:transcriptional regulator with XRE-family HTH domain
MLVDYERVTSPTDDTRGPTDKQIGRKLAALREIMGFDVEALAARSKLDVDLIIAIEAGTHSANVDELSDLVFALGTTITAITRPVDPQTR